MAYQLGSITLPQPANFERDQIEISRANLLFDGTTKKNFITRKERFVLKFDHLTQAQVNSILSEYNLNDVRNFTVSEPNLTISATPVHIEIKERNYATKGIQYREELTLILTEVT